ncbi:hypothetical protein [Cohnella herbarum]|uniref:Uncharacterized protein n=1 Tax=Cohnella herbarum TaxID=2728023 RepID=A0A7Z2VMV5_9BACL|nr:hypothetical protein [Cohnella herbarum]QJD85989.1 hypothetical protein HH215_24305 [Cohnella herbarum]
MWQYVDYEYRAWRDDRHRSVFLCVEVNMESTVKVVDYRVEIMPQVEDSSATKL